MIKIVLPILENLPWTQVEEAVTRCCTNEGLVVGIFTTLRQYPGSVHWHWRKEGTKGVLEVTAWEKKRLLYLKIQSGRNAPWVEPCAERLQEALAAALGGD